ncbi:hypothetical protein IWZ01DRAFT_74307 [Phyllosticta capitalensis]
MHGHFRSFSTPLANHLRSFRHLARQTGEAALSRQYSHLPTTYLGSFTTTNYLRSLLTYTEGGTHTGGGRDGREDAQKRVQKQKGREERQTRWTRIDDLVPTHGWQPTHTAPYGIGWTDGQTDRFRTQRQTGVTDWTDWVVGWLVGWLVGWGKTLKPREKRTYTPPTYIHASGFVWLETTAYMLPLLPRKCDAMRRGDGRTRREAMTVRSVGVHVYMSTLV